MKICDSKMRVRRYKTYDTTRFAHVTFNRKVIAEIDSLKEPGESRNDVLLHLLAHYKATYKATYNAKSVSKEYLRPVEAREIAKRKSTEFLKKHG